MLGEYPNEVHLGLDFLFLPLLPVLRQYNPLPLKVQRKQQSQGR